MTTTDRPTTTVEMDPDLQKVLEYMQRSVPADKLALVAESVPKAAQLLWGHYPRHEEFRPLALREPPPTTSAPPAVVGGPAALGPR